MANRLRYGIVGCGTIAPWHANGLQATQDAHLAAVCDVVEERARDLASKYPGEIAVHTDYKKMFATEKLDAISICVPSGTHGRVALDAAEAGIHILCEKPIEITLEKIDWMIGACKEANVKLACIFQRRTTPMWQIIRETVQSGKLGKMVLGDAYLKYYRSQEYYNSADWRGTWALDGGGCLMNQGVHCIDLLRWVMGPVDKIFAFADHLVRDIEVEDTVTAAIRFKNGAFGVLEGTTSVTPSREHRLEFHGEIGSILVDGEGIAEWNVPDVPAPGATGEAGGMGADPAAINGDGHAIQIADFCKAIMEDRPPMVDGSEARKAVELILAVYQSARTGVPVNL